MDACKVRNLLVITSLFSFSLFGQQQNSYDLKAEISLPDKVVRLDSLLKRISQRTGFIFSYNAHKIKKESLIHLAQKKNSVRGLLDAIEQEIGIISVLADSHIILKPAPPKPTATEVKLALPALTKKEPTPVKDTLNSTIKITEPTIEDQLNTVSGLKSDTIKEQANSSKEAIKESTLVSSESVTPARTSVKTDSVRSKPESPKKEKTIVPRKSVTPFETKFGIGADESHFIGPAIQFGLPYAFATLSYRTNFDFGFFSYGLGSSFKVGEKTRMMLFISAGSLSKSYGITKDSSKDSLKINYSITAKSNLTRLGFMIERPINQKLVLQVGLQYNSLSTQYTVNGASSEIGFIGSDADKTISTISPPYTLTNTYSANTSSNVKSWIGLQVNLLYTINFKKGR